MDAHDVIVIGGGPAGSSCAWQLHVAGLDVLVVDRRIFPRDKPCAGWVTPQVLESLDLDVDEYRRTRAWQPITGFRCGVIGGRSTQILYDEPVSYGIRRREFDEYLLRRCGAQVLLGEGARTLQRSDSRWIVNDHLTAKYLVGAGGHFCPVARMLGARRGRTSTVVVAQEVEFRLSAGEQNQVRVGREIPELYFCKDLRGYGWCFHKGEYLNIGLGRADATALTDHVTQFCEFLRQQERVARIPSRFTGHAYRLYEKARPRLSDEAVALVGDAAGLAYPLSGEGIRPAVESGLLAAQVIVAAARRGDSDLSEYEQLIFARLGAPRRSVPGRWLPMAWIQFLGARFLATGWFARHVVMNRWFLHRGQSALKTHPCRL